MSLDHMTIVASEDFANNYVDSSHLSPQRNPTHHFPPRRRGAPPLPRRGPNYSDSAFYYILIFVQMKKYYSLRYRV